MFFLCLPPGVFIPAFLLESTSSQHFSLFTFSVSMTSPHLRCAPSSSSSSSDGLLVIAWLSPTVACNLHLLFLFFISLRRVPSGEDRGSVQREVPCDQEAGVGPFLHRMAMLGHTVSQRERKKEREREGLLFQSFTSPCSLNTHVYHSQTTHTVTHAHVDTNYCQSTPLHSSFSACHFQHIVVSVFTWKPGRMDHSIVQLGSPSTETQPHTYTEQWC